MDEQEFAKVLKQYREKSDRHILVLETDMSYSDVSYIGKDADKLRKAKNELVAIMNKNYKQLKRTKRYRKLLKLYGKFKDALKNNKANKDLKESLKNIGNQLNEMQLQYHVTWDYCRTSMIPIGKKYKLNSVIALTGAEDVWKGVESILYSDGEELHFSKYDNLPTLRAKQINKSIILKITNNKVSFSYNSIKFGIKIKDRFQTEEILAMLSYLNEPSKYNNLAVEKLIEEAYCIDTYRPCYATLVTKFIRGKYRIFIHITLEGKAKPKYNKDGTFRHTYGKGRIGIDIGTQTIAYTSDTKVGLKNLSERGSSISTNERKERLIYRAMDRSRRATNPDNYNKDGTIKKGKKTWVYSNRYKRLRAKHRDLCRKNAINRQLAINEDVNHLRELGDFIVTEPKNASKLMKRAKKTETNEKGKYKRKKRFGKSIKNRCPGAFQAKLQKKFESTDGIYIEVPTTYRASQYDHTADEYIKKKLSDRIYNLKDGTKVQRDWYSSFLLYCYDYITQDIDKDKCKQLFNEQYNKELLLIESIKEKKLRILNSGIKVA